MNRPIYQKPSDQASSTKKAALETQDFSMGLPNTINNQIKKTEAAIDEDRLRVKDKADRATVENCLDPRTMI